MGYMGFGMQKWIYTSKPRKPFSKDRKGFGNTIPKLQTKNIFDHKTQISGKILEHKTPEEKIQEQNLKRKQKTFRFILLIAVVTIISIISVNYFRGENVRWENRNNKLRNYRTRIEKEKEKAYLMIKANADKQLKLKNYASAINEFKQLTVLKPNGIKEKKALANVLYLACMEQNIECDWAIYVNNQLSKTSDISFYLNRLADIYIHLGEYEKADEVLNRNLK